MVSAAKAAGGLASLYPNGDSVNAPWPVSMAVSHALAILSWMELPEEDRPSETIWLEPEMLEHHFNEVKARWADRSGGKELEGQNTLVENDLTKGLRNG